MQLTREATVGGDHTADAHVVGSVGGTLLFDSLSERERPLRAGERVEFKAMDGVINRLDFGADTLKVEMHATVSA